MTDNPWTPLRAKLEVATEGSRELDQDMDWLLFARARFVTRNGCYGWPEYRHPAALTFSLDAIVAVVKGMGLCIELYQSYDGTWWDCLLRRQNSESCIGATEGGVPTPALALCLALVRYMEAEGGDAP